MISREIAISFTISAALQKRALTKGVFLSSEQTVSIPLRDLPLEWRGRLSNLITVAIKTGLIRLTIPEWDSSGGWETSSIWVLDSLFLVEDLPRPYESADYGLDWNILPVLQEWWSKYEPARQYVDRQKGRNR